MAGRRRGAPGAVAGGLAGKQVGSAAGGALSQTRPGIIAGRVAGSAAKAVAKPVAKASKAVRKAADKTVGRAYRDAKREVKATASDLKGGVPSATAEAYVNSLKHLTGIGRPRSVVKSFGRGASAARSTRKRNEAMDKLYYAFKKTANYPVMTPAPAPAPTMQQPAQVVNKTVVKAPKPAIRPFTVATALGGGTLLYRNRKNRRYRSCHLRLLTRLP